MYKIASENMQRRARGRIIPNSECNEELLLKDNQEKRQALVSNLRLYENTICEIRKILKVPKGFLFNKIKHGTFPKDCTEWVTWQTLIPKIDEIRKQLSVLPKPKHANISNYMLDYLEKNYPDIHDACKIGGFRMAREDLRLDEADNVH